MSQVAFGLGTQLRQLLARLDGDVQEAYDALGVPFRPRFYPIARLLLDAESSGVNAIASLTGVSQPAATQTINEMKKAGILEVASGSDRRSRAVRLTAEGRVLAARLEPLWEAVGRAAAELDRELPVPLPTLIGAALEALDRRPFGERVDAKMKAERIEK